MSLVVSSGGVPSSLVTGASCFLSLIACNGPLSTVSGRTLSLVANNGPLFAVSTHFLFPIVGGSSLSTIFGSCVLFLCLLLALGSHSCFVL